MYPKDTTIASSSAPAIKCEQFDEDLKVPVGNDDAPGDEFKEIVYDDTNN